MEAPLETHYRVCRQFALSLAAPLLAVMILMEPQASALGKGRHGSNPAPEAAISPSLPAGHGSLLVLQFNVGNAYVGCPPRKPSSTDRVRLNDPADIARIRAYFTALQPDVILLQETLGGENQLFGPSNPLLPANYQAACPTSTSESGGIVCVAWRSDRLFLDAPSPDPACVGVSNSSGGVVRCRLDYLGQPIQFVSSYVPNLGRCFPIIGCFGHKEDSVREEVLSWIWNSSLVNRNMPAIVTGDFNTEECTDERPSSKCSYPYPPEFGTLFGRSVSGYGRWSPHDTFYGHYANSGKKIAESSESVHVCGFKVAENRYDHIFSNFGKGSPLEGYNQGTRYGCGSASCIAGETGFKVPLNQQCRSCDHKPVATRLDW